MSNSVDPDEMAHYEPSHLDLCCLQKPNIIACGSERVKKNFKTLKVDACISLVSLYIMMNLRRYMYDTYTIDRVNWYSVYNTVHTLGLRPFVLNKINVKKIGFGNEQHITD